MAEAHKNTYRVLQHIVAKKMKFGFLAFLRKRLTCASLRLLQGGQAMLHLVLHLNLASIKTVFFIKTLRQSAPPGSALLAFSETELIESKMLCLLKCKIQMTQMLLAFI